MKLILFSGSHPRHLYVNSEIIKHFDKNAKAKLSGPPDTATAKLGCIDNLLLKSL